MCRLRIIQVEFWNDGTLRKTAILRTTVLVAGKNGYELRLSRNPYWNPVRAPVIEVTTAKRRQSAANDARYVMAA